MSLINDALKQAGKAQQENPPPPSKLEFRAVEESLRRPYTPPAILLAVLLVALALGGVLVGLALQKSPANPGLVKAHQPDAPVTPTDPGPTDTSTPSEYARMAPSVATSAPSAPAAIPTEAPAAPTAIAPSAVPTNAVAVAPVEPPKPVAPKLQGIFYNPSQPSAVVSGKTVYVGNHVGEFAVTKITKEHVTLTSATQTNVLSLSE